MKPRRVLLRTVLLTALFVPTLLHAQAPHPRAILQRSAQACAAVRSATYDVVHTMQWIGGRVTGPEHARVWMRRTAPAGLEHTLMRTVPDSSDVATYNIERAMVMRPSKAIVMTADSANNAAQFLHPTSLIFVQGPLTDSLPFQYELDSASTLTYEGTAEVEGVRCHMILVRHPDWGEIFNRSTRVAVGVADHLPRALHSELTWNGEPEIRDMRISNLITNQPERVADDSLFVIKVPPDYKVHVSGTGGKPVKLPERKLPEPLGIGTAAPAWTSKNSRDTVISSEKLRGSIVVLDFWGSWCAPCIKALPEVQKLHEKYRGHAVAVVGISCQENGGDPVTMFTRKKCTYDLVLNGDSIAVQYHASALPMLYVLDRSGRVAYADIGFDPVQKLKAVEAVIERLLAAEAKERRRKE